MQAIFSWIDATQMRRAEGDQRALDRVDWLRIAPFLAVHLGCVGVFFVGTSSVALATAALLYAVRMFAITGFYHRYFSHRAFRMNRFWQFVFAVLGNSATQRGPIWWASQHRHHHTHSDTALDAHSPVQHGFFRSHVTWFLTPRGFQTRSERVSDLLRYPELRLLDRFSSLVPAMLAVGLYAFGAWYGARDPASGVTGAQMFFWGFCVSTVVLWHATFAINSLAHLIGTRAYETRDDSRNSLLLALLTFGEGWHNNHHRYPGSARQGHRWWQIDLTWWGLRLLAAVGIVSELKER